MSYSFQIQTDAMSDTQKYTLVFSVMDPKIFDSNLTVSYVFTDSKELHIL